jgi:hypothetical protein
MQGYKLLKVMALVQLRPPTAQWSRQRWNSDHHHELNGFNWNERERSFRDDEDSTCVVFVRGREVRNGRSFVQMLDALCRWFVTAFLSQMFFTRSASPGILRVVQLPGVLRRSAPRNRPLPSFVTFWF